MKEKIPATVRNSCWNYYIGSENRKGLCFCCSTEDISTANFHCGHVISESNGGKVHLGNLRPICGHCNSSMGRKNMTEFMEKYGFVKCENWDRYRKKIPLKTLEKNDGMVEKKPFKTIYISCHLKKKYDIRTHDNFVNVNDFFECFDVQKTTDLDYEDFIKKDGEIYISSKECRQIIKKNKKNDTIFILMSELNMLFKCDKCGRFFSTKQKLQEHMNKKNKCDMNPRAYKCEACDKFITNKSNYTKHLKTDKHKKNTEIHTMNNSSVTVL